MRFRAPSPRPSPRLFPLLSVLVVAGCVGPPRPAPPPAAPPPVIVALPAPRPVPADWRDRPYSPGDWRHVADAVRPAARYRTAGGTTLFALDCDRPARTIAIVLAGPAATLTIRTTSTQRTLPVRALAGTDPAATPMIVATLPAADPLFDAMAFSRGRFSVERPGAEPLTLPAWAEVGRLIDDCRA